METRTIAMPESQAATKRGLTVEEFDALPDMDLEEGDWCELHDGEVVVVVGLTAAPHDWVASRLGHALARQVEETGRGVVIHSGAVVLGRHVKVKPDLLVLLRENLGRIRKDAVRGAPDLIAEVLSPGTAMTDFGRKRRFYETHGVREYWIVDPEGRALLQLVLEGPVYRAAGLHSGNTVFRPAILPDLDVDLGKIWPPEFPAEEEGPAAGEAGKP